MFLLFDRNLLNSGSGRTYTN